MKLTDKLYEKFGMDKVLHFFFGAWFISQFDDVEFMYGILALIPLAILSNLKERFFDDEKERGDVISSILGGIF